MANRIAKSFSKGKNIITFIMGGDESLDETFEIMKSLAESGVDIIEVGMPFSDPSADGEVIQAAATRALASKTDISGILKVVKRFREINDSTPIILMGYYNPIFKYGIKKFAEDASNSGVDGLIIVDLSLEEEEETVAHFKSNELSLIKLIAPTTSAERLPDIIKNASGFVYLVSVAGVTGVKSATEQEIKQYTDRVRSTTSLPVAVGFGIKTPEQAKKVLNFSDAVVIGSALVNYLHNNEANKADSASFFVSDFVKIK